MVNMENLQVSDNETITSPKKGRGQYERKARGSYQKHKLEKKITVKHFLNKRIDFNKKMVQKGGFSFDDDTPSYPIYVQVTFNRKTTMLRSATDEICSGDEEFIDLMEDPDYSQLFKRERTFIEYYIQNYFNRHINSFSVFKKKFEDDYIELEAERTFDLDSVISGFSYDDHMLVKSVEYGLKVELKKFAQEIVINEIKERTGRNILDENDRVELFDKLDFYRPIDDSLERPDNNISALELLSFYEMRKAEFKEMRLRFSSEIWHFNIFYGMLYYSGDSLYNELSATILDFQKGDFKSIFLNYFSEEKQKVEKIIADIEILIENESMF
jgi:hypothetical protein